MSHNCFCANESFVTSWQVETSKFAALQAMAQGQVQGVYYRVFTSRNAIRLGLIGYVRNLPDMSVEIYAEGERKQLGKLIEQLKEGPLGKSR